MPSVARSFIWVTLSRALDGAVRFFTVPIVLHYFGRADFGLLALAFSMHVFLSIADFGVSVNAVRRLSELFHQRRHADIAQLARAATFFYALIGAANLAIVVLLGVCGRQWFQLDERQAHAFFWMMLSLGVSSAVTWTFSIHRQILHASAQVGWDESINLIASVLTVVVVAATLHWRLRIEVYFALLMLPPLVPLALRVRRVMQTVPGLRPGLSADWTLFRPLVGASLWLFLLSLGELLANNYRPVILAQQAGLESVADFRVIQQVAGFATLLLSGFMSVLYPLIAQLDAAHDESRLNLALRQGSRLLLWAHLGILIPLAFAAETLLHLYVGRSFTHLTVALTVWLLTLLAYHNTAISSFIMARGELRLLTLSSLAAAALSLGAAYGLAARYGVMATVGTYSVYMAIQLAVLYGGALKRAGGGSGLALAWDVFPRPVMGAAVTAAAAWAVSTAAGRGWWLAAVVFVPLFAAWAWGLGGVKADLRALKPAA